MHENLHAVDLISLRHAHYIYMYIKKKHSDICC